MKKIISITLLLLLLTSFSWAWLNFTGEGKRLKTSRLAESNKTDYFKKLQVRAADAKEFAKKNNFNQRICFLIDMSIPSGQNRFFVYDLRKDTIQNAGLVTHGRCNESWLEGRKFGNTVGCGCTSVCKYKVGKSYYGRFGLAFKLHGLEKTNNKSFERFVVLHAHDCVPETEVKNEICQSDGCPTVAPGFLQQLKPIIQNSSKPVLLWIFE
ncbi:MAG: hypothetical protein C4308_12435 [Chitinophagaceae bacterium]